MKKKLLAMLLAVVLAVTLLAGTALALDGSTVGGPGGGVVPPVGTSGTCGDYENPDSMTWDLTDGVLTIAGTGAMQDYWLQIGEPGYDSPPWEYYSDETRAYSEEIHTVVIGDGVTTIGANAFMNCWNLTSVTIPASVTRIGNLGQGAFSGCTSLTSVTIPDGVTIIYTYAFYGCTSLTSVTIPASVTDIGPGAFFDCPSLTDVYYGGSESQWGAIMGFTANWGEEAAFADGGAEFSGLSDVTVHYNSAAPTQPGTPSVPVAYPSTQKVDLNGNEVEFQMYALKDANGNDTNHIKIRDLALALNGTSATFNIGWANGVSAITTGAAYEPNGTENSTPFSGQRPYTKSATSFILNGTAVDLEGIVLTDDAGGGYTYCQVKDLAAKLNFTARWDSARQIICIETE